MNILVTGATGFIGRHLVERLSQTGTDTIFCLVRNPRKAKLLPQGVKCIYADITAFESLKKMLSYKIDIVFHCAGYVENKNRDLLHKVNVIGSENVCRLSQELNAERMVYISSVAVVSGNNDVPLYEEMPYKATNIYGESKIEAEKKVLKYREKGLRCIILRPPMVYGRGEPHMLGLLLFLLRCRLLPLINGGNSKLHLVYIKNVVEAMIFSLTKHEFLEGTFFIADNEVLTAKQILTILSKAINVSLPADIPAFLNYLLLNLPFVGGRARFLAKDRVYSIDKIKSLGFNPPYSVELSLSSSARHVQGKGSSLQPVD